MKRIRRTNGPNLIKLIVSVAVVTAVLMTLFAMFVPQSRHRINAKRVSSVNTLKQVSFDLPSTFPQKISETNGGAMP